MALDIKATLRISSVKHNLLELTDSLGSPNKGFSIGESYSRGSKNRAHTYWSIDSSGISERADLNSHILEILKFLNANECKIIEIQEEGANIDISCFFGSDNGQGAASLSANIIQQLSRFKLDLNFDVYAD